MDRGQLPPEQQPSSLRRTPMVFVLVLCALSLAGTVALAASTVDLHGIAEELGASFEYPDEPGGSTKM